MTTDLIGRRIGQYEIIAPLGAGGMGVVYRAHDHSLGRSVAIKVLPEAFAADPDRLARLEREARLLALLGHPHIAAIHGLEKTADLSALVLELIDGETLEARLRRGAIGVAQSLTLGTQIADALDHAHRRGVTHRDLKPGNIMLTRAGAKLLDFGLAKWSDSTAGAVATFGATADARPHGASTITAQGAIMGTLHYLAPEQLEGKPADARADLFAFGAVLYEMVSGRRAFDGDSAAAVMAAIMNMDPPHPIPGIPAGFDRAIRKALEKSPDDRWQSARDLADELKWLAEDLVRGPSPPSSAPQVAAPVARRRSAWAIGAAAAAVTTALAAWAGWTYASSRGGESPRAVTRFDVFATPDMADEIRSGDMNAFAISPDGRTLVYAGSPPSAGDPRLYIRRLDQFDDAPIIGTANAFNPFFSADGQWLGFFTDAGLMKVNVQTGSTPVLVCACRGKAGGANGAAWLQDGTIVLTRTNKGLLRVSAEGGNPVELTTLTDSPPEFDHHNPAPLPGGRAILFTAHAASGQFDVAALILATGERKVLVESAYDASYLPSGHLVFARQGTILAAPFDLDRLAVIGPAVTLVDRVTGNPGDGEGGYKVSTTGALVFRPAPSTDGRTLTWVNRSGDESPIALSPRAFTTPRVSPDGTRIAFAVDQSGRRDVYVYELATTKLTRLTEADFNKTPLWTRDGKRIVYGSNRGGVPQLWWEPADGNGTAEPIVAGGDAIVTGSWAADGRTLLYVDENNGPAGSRTKLISTATDRQPRPLLSEERITRQPSVSPDGKWVAFTDFGAGPTVQVQVAAFPDVSRRHQVTLNGGREPLWSRDGKELSYRFGSSVYVVSIDTSNGFRASAPVLLFQRPYVDGNRDDMGLDYDRAPDGRFLMMKPSPDELRFNRFSVVLNWIDEVAQRVPGAR